MPNIVFDASSLVGALLKEGSMPERALIVARARDVICLSATVVDEIRSVFIRPKFHRYLAPRRTEQILDLLMAAALFVEPTETIADCRDPTDNKYLELALAAQAKAIVASDNDLLALDPWRGVRILTPAGYLASREA
jgi:uncharacterized protein